MVYKYTDIIEDTKKTGGILDVMLALQKTEGYLTEAAIHALAESFQMTPAHVYDTASFYGMIRLSVPPLHDVRICRGAPCHVAGAQEVIHEIEKILDIKIEEYSEKGQCYFGYTECLGQCQASPTIVIDEKLYTGVTPDTVREILKEGGVL